MNMYMHITYIYAYMYACMYIPRHGSAWLLGRRKVPHRLHFRLNIPRFFFSAVLIEFLFFAVKAIPFLPGSPAAGSPAVSVFVLLYW
jgi:hypothetical protein